MAKLADFYRFIKPYCPGASEPAIDQALLDAAEEFCRRAQCVLVDAEVVSIVAGQRDYELYVETNDVQIVGIDSAAVDNGIGKPRYLTPCRPHRKSAAVSDSPQEFWMPVRGTIRLHPTPESGGDQLHAVVATAPLQSARVLDDTLLTEWNTPISAGAIARLYMTPGRAYSAPQSAPAYVGIFEAGVREAYARAHQGGVRARLRSKPVR